MIAKATSYEQINVEIRESRQLAMYGKIKDVTSALHLLAVIFGSRPIITISDEEVQTALVRAAEAEQRRAKLRRH